MNQPRQAIADAGIVVVKLGTAVLTGGSSVIDRGYLVDIAAALAARILGGKRIVIVSSGAVGAGLAALGLSSRPSDVAMLQASAAAGQPLLMSLWREAFAIRCVPVAQILLGRDDIDSRERFLNIRNCISALFERGAVPIVNENDTVATEEISLGDNDVLAARIAVAVHADALVILTTGPGVLDDADRVIAEAPDAASLTRFVRPTKTTQGRGGMTTKIEAARIAGLAGISTVIAPGRPSETVVDVLRGASVGTCIASSESRHSGKRRWIALGATPTGGVRVDDGAARAIVHHGASLLAKGVTHVDGEFRAGDVILVSDALGNEIARGLVNIASQEARLVQARDSGDFEAILGRRTHEELIHRDNLIVLPA